MLPLNPFLRAFFQSSIPSQCTPIQHHVLLVPTSESLIYGFDRDTNAAFSELISSEEYLASHVLRVPGGVAPRGDPSDAAAFKETRGKAKQYSTINARTVVIKDAFVYSNKGFRALNQAQLLGDAIYHPDTPEFQQWLIYYVSKPLLGTFESTLPESSLTVEGPPSRKRSYASQETENQEKGQGKKDIKSFGDLMSNFPIIGRQMQPGLEKVFKDFSSDVERPLSAPTLVRKSTTASLRSRYSTSSNDSKADSSANSISGASIARPPSTISLYDEEDAMRRALENAVTAAIDLFQAIDKQQLSLLGATTELTGPVVERMIERYVAEQVNDSILFPQVCNLRKKADHMLEANMRQMSDVDISQVGIPLENGEEESFEFLRRIGLAVDAFKKMGGASSPQDMLDALLATQKALTASETAKSADNETSSDKAPEKSAVTLTINADILVAMLLLVVIRSPVRRLQARLSYMRHFIFIDDVEAGELGYALSTYEAVLTYITQDSDRLRRASRGNRRLWQATKSSDMATLKLLLESPSFIDNDVLMSEPEEDDAFRDTGVPDSNPNFPESDQSTLAEEPLSGEASTQAQTLAHVFPFQQQPPTPPPEEVRPRKKRVSMASSVTTVSSGFSSHSRSNTSESHLQDFEFDVSIDTLSKTRNASGASVLMMAIENSASNALKYLLSLDRIYPIEFVLEDKDEDGATLLSKAVQIGNSEMTEVLLDFILNNAAGAPTVEKYFARKDVNGRCFAHFLFNQPHLIPRIGHLFPWRLKDKNGQTPLFALCRSYDHDDYKWMVDNAIKAAMSTQEDGERLHVDDHIDGKGNSLLHIINEPLITSAVMKTCDCDVNAANDKRFTPLMMVSKYGKVELMKSFVADPRVDIWAKDFRGLTAVDLAKDDDVRNRFDDLLLLARNRTTTPDGRNTTVIRSLFVDDGSVRFILKSAAPNPNDTITVTTSRRSPTDFDNLGRWLLVEHPSSYIPGIPYLHSPYLIPSRPSRTMLRDHQLRYDSFLKALLNHPTFATHEMVWEFFLVPDMDATLIQQRSQRKAELRIERVHEDLEPVPDTGIRDVTTFLTHARESVRSIDLATRQLTRRVNNSRHKYTDLHDAHCLANKTLQQPFSDLPRTYLKSFDAYTATLKQTEMSPLTNLYYHLIASQSSSTALLAALQRPSTLIDSLNATKRTIDKHIAGAQRHSRWPGAGLFDDARKTVQASHIAREAEARTELERQGKELRYTEEVVVGELAGWQTSRETKVKEILREHARQQVNTERARLESMLRAVRELGIKSDGVVRRRSLLRRGTIELRDSL